VKRRLRLAAERLQAIALANAPGLDRVLPYAPRSATLHATDNCFFRCVMCDQWREHKSGELTTDEWKDVARQLRELGVEHVSFAGGEPFMRKDLLELIEHLGGLGFSSSLITNGFVVDRARLERAVAGGLRAVGLSVDAVGAAFDRIRGIAGGFERLLLACEPLSALKAAGRLEVHVYFTLMRPTLGAVPDVLALARRFGFPLVVNLFDHTPYFFRGLAARRHEYWIDPRDPALAEAQAFLAGEKAKDPQSVYHTAGEIAWFRDYFVDPVQPSLPCVVSQQRLGIDSRGDVHGGCWSLGTFGNVRERRLREIVGSQRYREAHRAMLRKQCPGCSCGYSGNLRPSLRHGGRERAARLLPALGRGAGAGR
jgi:MoaA/NifB/PqqE/SkfB family radical SAM enzyme